MKDDNCEIIIEEEKIMERWRQYFMNLLEGKEEETRQTLVERDKQDERRQGTGNRQYHYRNDKRRKKQSNEDASNTDEESTKYRDSPK
ncbi:hypothetical protein ILUMI_16959 [Ignelater luminosus]|uniref:Uncharacterized protein n=1 Tax=Ignelater luminosus TaxID=2038154 RepID=A0A8K0G7Q6_IGNLU|nr:hypothetical protein ILUMI_16959 [Ignelater luminosus]